MTSKTVTRLRNSAALLISVSGLWQIAMLWIGQLTGAALIDALRGTIYLFIAIGLAGHSRFTLFLAIIVPAVAASQLLNSASLLALSAPQLARLAVDALVILISCVVLWRVRNEPGN